VVVLSAVEYCCWYFGGVLLPAYAVAKVGACLPYGSVRLQLDRHAVRVETYLVLLSLRGMVMILGVNKLKVRS
jgi:hypothetical protein